MQEVAFAGNGKGWEISGINLNSKTQQKITNSTIDTCKAKYSTRNTPKILKRKNL